MIILMARMIGMIGQIILVGRMMDIYCLGGKTWLICGPKEAKTIQYTLVGAAKRSPKEYIAKFGFLWAANQPGLSPPGSHFFLSDDNAATTLMFQPRRYCMPCFIKPPRWVTKPVVEGHKNMTSCNNIAQLMNKLSRTLIEKQCRAYHSFEQPQAICTILIVPDTH